MITNDPMGEFAALCAIGCVLITAVFAVLNIVFIVINLIKKCVISIDKRLRHE